MQSAKERRTWQLGNGTSRMSREILGFLQNLDEDYGSDPEVRELIDASRYRLNHLVAIGEELKGDEPFESQGKQYLLSSLQQKFRELDTFISLNLKVLYPATKGEVPDPIEQLKNSIEQ